MMKFVILTVLVAVAAAEMDLDVHLGGLPMQNPDLFQGDILGYEPGDRNVIPYQQMRWTGKVVPYVIDPSLLNLGGLPMQNPDLFQGDILGYEPGDRNVIPYNHMRWTNREVPYVIDPSLSDYTSLIEESMTDYHLHTCIRFKRRSSEFNYIRIFAGEGCYSNVGMIGGQQPVSLGSGCMYRGIIIHELGHAIGFFHEQNRSDRDQYLLIYWNNIQKGMESQFALLQPNENILYTTFDYNSIMCYGETAFSKDGRSKTMVAKSGVRLYEPYEKPGLTPSDVTRVERMYGC